MQRVRVETDEEITGIGKSSTTHSSHNFAAQRTGSVRRELVVRAVGFRNTELLGNLFRAILPAARNRCDFALATSLQAGMCPVLAICAVLMMP